jgi:hypothetical protein
MDGYIVDVVTARLRDAPHYTSDADPWTNPPYGRAIDDYHGISGQR